MVVIKVPTNYQKAKIVWKNWMHQAYVPFNNVQLKIVSGELPSDLHGNLFRSQNACFLRKFQKVGHVYDGDGGLLKVQFDRGQAYASFNIYNTKFFETEQQNDEFTFYSWGRNQLHSNFLSKLTSRNPRIKNTGNAGIFKFPKSNELLALSFYGLPYLIDPQSLQIIKEHNFDGILSQDCTLGLYFKHDRQDYEKIFNFSYNKVQNVLKLYEFDLEGNIVRQQDHQFQQQRMLFQDFCLAGDYLIFFRQPISESSMKIPFKKSTYWDQLSYDVNEGTELLIYDKNTFELVSQNICDAFMATQFLNGAISGDGQIILDFIQHADNKYLKVLQDIPTEQITTNGFNGKVHRIRINPRNGIVTKQQKMNVYPCNLATYNQRNTGTTLCDSYLNINSHRKEYDIANTVAKLKLNGDIQVYGEKLREVYLGSPTLTQDGQYVLSVGFNTIDNTSEVHIINTQNMKQVGVLQIPQVIPFSFQGFYQSR